MIRNGSFLNSAVSEELQIEKVESGNFNDLGLQNIVVCIYIYIVAMYIYIYVYKHTILIFKRCQLRILNLGSVVWR